MILAYGVISLLVLAAVGSYWAEHRQWNGGISRLSGAPWVLTAQDSSGAMGYDDGHGNTCWISFGSINKLGPPDPGS